jgi:hypothetical protein
MPPLSDFAPVIIAAIMAAVGLLLTWHAWWQAHSGDRKDGRNKPEAGE